MGRSDNFTLCHTERRGQQSSSDTSGRVLAIAEGTSVTIGANGNELHGIILAYDPDARVLTYQDTAPDGARHYVPLTSIRSIGVEKSRVLTQTELETAQTRQGRKPEYVAARFAAKEAVVKGLGCGIGWQVGFQDIEVTPDAAGRPVCRVSPAALERRGLAPAAVRLHLSITHSATTTGAYTVAEWV
jgi:holo-[acyl-carrier protein] synthase